MDVGNIPWDRPLGVVFAIALLAIFLDLTYRKIPRGFTRLRTELRRQTASLSHKGDEGEKLLHTVVTSIDRLDVAIAALLERLDEQEQNRGQRRPRRRKKSTGPADTKG